MEQRPPASPQPPQYSNLEALHTNPATYHASAFMSETHKAGAPGMGIGDASPYWNKLPWYRRYWILLLLLIVLIVAGAVGGGVGGALAAERKKTNRLVLDPTTTGTGIGLGATTYASFSLFHILVYKMVTELSVEHTYTSCSEFSYKIQ